MIFSSGESDKFDRYAVKTLQRCVWLSFIFFGVLKVAFLGRHVKLTVLMANGHEGDHRLSSVF